MMPLGLRRLVNNLANRQKVDSLYSQLNDFILAAIEWAQRDLRFWFHVLKYSMLCPHTVFSPPPYLFPMTFTLHLVFTYTRKKKEYFEYDACRTRCLNQIYEDTNLHLLSVWRGFPYRNKRLGFPEPKLGSMPLKAICTDRKNHFKALLKSINDNLWTKLILFWET